MSDFTADEQRMIDLIKAEDRRDAIRDFATESNRIEGITELGRDGRHAVALGQFLDLQRLTVIDVREFVAYIEPKAKLRDRLARSVTIREGSKVLYRPPQGGPELVGRLEELLEDISRGDLSPAEGHVLYETLHPFTDGNGRSGRAIWAWAMEKAGEKPFGLPFLHRWYYQSLDLARRRAGAPG